jgi:hypothetical protein
MKAETDIIANIAESDEMSCDNYCRELQK